MTEPHYLVNGLNDLSTTWYLWVEHVRARTLLAVVTEYTTQSQVARIAHVSGPATTGSAVMVQPCTRIELLALIKRILADRRLSGFGDVWFKSQAVLDAEPKTRLFDSCLGRFLRWARE